jgi:hypothetical protein
MPSWWYLSAKLAGATNAWGFRGCFNNCPRCFEAKRKVGDLLLLGHKDKIFSAERQSAGLEDFSSNAAR